MYVHFFCLHKLRHITHTTWHLNQTLYLGTLYKTNRAISFFFTNTQYAIVCMHQNLFKQIACLLTFFSVLSITSNALMNILPHTYCICVNIIRDKFLKVSAAGPNGYMDLILVDVTKLSCKEGHVSPFRLL